jgi:hypothetical protein
VGLVVLTEGMLEAHAEHDTKRERCPICARFGPVPAEGAYSGRMIPVNAPATTDPSTW